MPTNIGDEGTINLSDFIFDLTITRCETKYLKPVTVYVSVISEISQAC